MGVEGGGSTRIFWIYRRSFEQKLRLIPSNAILFHVISALAIAAPPKEIYSGLWSFNALLCSSCLGGFFFVLTFQSHILALFSGNVSETFALCINCIKQEYLVDKTKNHKFWPLDLFRNTDNHRSSYLMCMPFLYFHCSIVRYGHIWGFQFRIETCKSRFLVLTLPLA